MEHDLIEAILKPETKIITSVISYVYECETCNEMRRYAIPENDENGNAMSVFCNGLDFTTSVCDVNSVNHQLNLELMNE